MFFFSIEQKKLKHQTKSCFLYASNENKKLRLCNRFVHKKIYFRMSYANEFKIYGCSYVMRIYFLV